MIRNKSSFRLLWMSQALSNCGDVFYIAGIISIIFQMSGSAFMMSLVPFFITLSRFLGSILAPLCINQFSLRRIVSLCHLIKSVLMAILVAYIWSSGEVFGIFPAISFIAFIDGCTAPAQRSMIPLLVEKTILVKANSFFSIVENIVELGGWPASGILIALLNGKILLFMTLFLFFISFIMVSFIHYAEERKISHPATKWIVLKEGWTAIWRTPVFKTIAIIELVDSMANVVWIAAILYVYVEEILAKSEAWWGYINSAFFAGLLLSGIGLYRIEQSVKNKLHGAIIFVTIFSGIFTLCFGLSSIPWLSLVFSLLTGAVAQIKLLGQQTVVQLKASTNLLPKVISARESISTGVFGISSLMMGLVAEHFGVQSVFAIAALLQISVGFWALANQKALQI
ncbi:MFS transporter [Bacillus norwichensis]|uniref:MFS transporter n=1 Tax=Bacillus norwichensis TaxID=2762217 RepID=A0ABR8VJX0_9BACI|nr:MFS transporter [Bacillus norwichensis]MBD8005053.1 MFS transporter [Bacillus norwichensis]